VGRSRGLAAHHLLDDLIFVDGVGNGLAHADIGKGVPGLLDVHVDAASGRTGDHVHVGHLLDAFDQGHGHAVDDVDLFAGQGGKAGGLFGDGSDVHLLYLGLAFPVIGLASMRT
jgi:hypothetical protein